MAVSGWAFSAKVVRVSDGDTLWVQQNGGSKVKVRLYAIDCPETAQAYGQAATKFTASRALNRNVDVKVIEKDQYGRLVAIVTIKNDGISLNEDLVRYGYAWYYPQFCKSGAFCTSLKRLEQEARKQYLGLWQEHDPEPPWDFRRKVRDRRNEPDSIDWDQVFAEFKMFSKEFYYTVKMVALKCVKYLVNDWSGSSL